MGPGGAVDEKRCNISRETVPSSAMDANNEILKFDWLQWDI